MKHKVTCMDCGKVSRIEVEHGKKVESGWLYYGKLNINVCQTDKYFWRPKNPEKSFLGDLERVPNECYDPNVKPKYVELWVCPTCAKMVDKEKSSTESGKSSPYKPLGHRKNCECLQCKLCREWKKKEDKCLLDDKKCYIHHDTDGFEIRCRHGFWIEATIPPCQKQLDALEQEKKTRKIDIVEKMDKIERRESLEEGKKGANQ
jgi:hypothetical protein